MGQFRFRIYVLKWFCSLREVPVRKNQKHLAQIFSAIISTIKQVHIVAPSIFSKPSNSIRAPFHFLCCQVILSHKSWKVTLKERFRPLPNATLFALTQPRLGVEHLIGKVLLHRLLKYMLALFPILQFFFLLVNFMICVSARL